MIKSPVLSVLKSFSKVPNKQIDLKFLKITAVFVNKPGNETEMKGKLQQKNRL